jgi:4-hydroxy-2-oxoheptanedioate aldolase
VYLTENRVRRAFDEKRPSFGLYLMTPSPRLIELFAGSGMDFIRIDMEGGAMDIQTVQNLIHAAHACEITPFVRVQGPDEWQIQTVLKLGALGIIIPKVSGVDDVKRAIRAAKPAPYGERHMSTATPTGGYGRASADEYAVWAERNIILSAQIETRTGVEAIDEIVALPGLDMVQSGRGDLSHHFGKPGDQYSPEVLAAERRVIEAGLASGKMTSVQYYPMRDRSHEQRVREFIAMGVYCLSLGADADIVVPYRTMLDSLKG